MLLQDGDVRHYTMPTDDARKNVRRQKINFLNKSVYVRKLCAMLMGKPLHLLCPADQDTEVGRFQQLAELSNPRAGKSRGLETRPAEMGAGSIRGRLVTAGHEFAITQHVRFHAS